MQIRTPGSPSIYQTKPPSGLRPPACLSLITLPIHWQGPEALAPLRSLGQRGHYWQAENCSPSSPPLTHTHPLPRPPPLAHGRCSAARPRPPGAQPAALAHPLGRSGRSRDPRAPRRRVAGASRRPVRAPARPLSSAPRGICMPRPRHRPSLPAAHRPRAPPTEPLRPTSAPR